MNGNARENISRDLSNDALALLEPRSVMDDVELGEILLGKREAGGLQTDVYNAVVAGFELGEWDVDVDLFPECNFTELSEDR